MFEKFRKLFGQKPRQKPEGPVVLSENFVLEVISKFGETLELASPPPLCVFDAAQLPYPKETIKKALQYKIVSVSDPTLMKHLVEAYMSLADWQEGIGSERVGFDLTSVDKAADPSTYAAEYKAGRAAYEKWRPILEKERQALSVDLQAIDLIRAGKVQLGAQADGPASGGPAA